MKYLRHYSLLAFAITLGFLVFGVEKAKERQKHLLNHLASVTDEINVDAKSLPEKIGFRALILSMDQSKFRLHMPQPHEVPHPTVLLDSSGVYEKYHSARLRYEYLKNKFNSLPIPDREWNFIAAMRHAEETYALNEPITGRFDILRVSTAQRQIQLHAFIDNDPVSKPMSGFQLRSDDKVGDIQVHYENPVTCEPHYINQKFY